MVSQEFVLAPTDRSPVLCQGHLMARAEGPTGDPKLFGRRHVITVIESRNHELYLQIEFLSNCLHEQPITVVEERLKFDEIDAVLMAYDPTEFVNLKHLRPRHASVGHRFRKLLWHKFDELMVSVQQQMSGFVEPCEAELPAAKSSESRLKRWLSFVTH